MEIFKNGDETLKNPQITFYLSEQFEFPQMFQSEKSFPDFMTNETPVIIHPTSTQEKNGVKFSIGEISSQYIYHIRSKLLTASQTTPEIVLKVYVDGENRIVRAPNDQLSCLDWMRKNFTFIYGGYVLIFGVIVFFLYLRSVSLTKKKELENQPKQVQGFSPTKISKEKI